MLHFVNDLYGTGWGIPLFWPLSKRKYKFFGSKLNQSRNMLCENNEYKTLGPLEQSHHAIVSWSEEELPLYIQRFGFDDWIDRVYLTVNWISITEYSLFITSVILLSVTLLY